MSARQQGYQLVNPGMLFSKDQNRMDSSRESIKRTMETLYRAGIYADIDADSIKVTTDKSTQKRSLAQFFKREEARRLSLQKLEPTLAILVEQNSDKLIIPNLLVDTQNYADLQAELLASIDPVMGMVKQNEVIVRQKQKLNEEAINKLNSLTQEYQSRGDSRSSLLQWLSFLGLLFFILVVVLTFNLYMCHTPLEEEHGLVGAAMLNAGFLLQILAAVFARQLLGLDSSLIPFAMLIISTAILLGHDFGIFYAACSILLLVPFLNWEASSIALLFSSTLITLALIRKYNSRHDFLRIWVFLYVSLNLINGALTLFFFNGENLTEKLGSLVRNAGYSLVSTTLSVLGCLVIVGFFERKWNRATKQILLELLDFNNPLLKRLATNAVGTYHHSLIVGNLTERAAEAIGANPLLARVGSYYHDIGKSVNPEIFTENNEASSEFYEKFSPEESADFIRDHVREGVVLAEKHRVPQPVIDIIQQHHGTSYIRYFLEAAKRLGEVAALDAFRYPGPLPQSKEAALVMLADVIESTSKSMQTANDEEINQLIDNTIKRLINEGQLDEAPITIKDLALAKQAMLPILESVFRKRLEYPEEGKS